MTVIKLLEDLEAFVRAETGELLLPLPIRKEDRGEQKHRAPQVHRMRLPNSERAKEYAPYVLIQAVDAEDAQQPGEQLSASVGVRLVFAVYDSDEPRGALALVEVMERVRIGLLRDVVIGGQFELDLTRNLQMAVYDQILAPYYAGELTAVFKRPEVKREDVTKWL